MYETSETKSESFYQYAMNIFNVAGYTDASFPVFANHTPEQVAYIDNENFVPLNKKQRELMQQVQNISFLFELEGDIFGPKNQQRIVFYSLELVCAESERSQAAYDINILFQTIINSNASVFLFSHEDNIVFTMAGYEIGCILSDWYNKEYDFSCIIEKLHIVNTCLNSAKEFFLDLSYNMAREYYIHPINYQSAKYTLIPIDYFTNEKYGAIDRNEINDISQNYLKFYENKYGDDYVAIEQYDFSRKIDMDAELELLLMELDDKDDSDFAEDEDWEESTEEIEEDEYEYNDLDSEIFRDPTLMVKLIEKKSNNKNT